ncbi:MAG: rhamnulokinase [Candidatus Aminicenantes bacterium]|nr:MAG: rhamnulokinase [Candidatus Aminicenantes bacterium]
MPSPSFLAFDLGAASGRAILGRLESNQLHIKELYRFANGMLPVRDHLHWDIFRLLEEIKKGLAICAGETKIASFAIDTWGVDFGLLDQNGTILGMPYAYRDPHTLGAMEEFFKLIPREKIYNSTGIQFLPFNSLFQLHAMKRDKSSSLEAANDLLFMPDLFHYFLTGEKKNEFTIATTSQLYNPRKMKWEDELFDTLGVSKSLMQEIVQPGFIIGKLDKKFAHQLGWKDVPVVAVACHDTGSAVASVPAHSQDWAFISSGTWSLMGIETENPIIDDLALRLNFTNEGGVEGTFRVLKNITGLWLLQKCREAWEPEKKISFEQMTAMAQESKSFPFFIDPDWEGFLNPADMPKAIRRYCNLTKQKIPQSPAEYVRGICESLALKYRVVLDEMKQISSKPIRRIHVIGGGSKNQVLCQFTANATGLPIFAGPAEATAIGNIMMQSKAHGCIQSLVQMREVIRDSFDVEVYEPLQVNEWRKASGLFQKIILREATNGKYPKD